MALSAALGAVSIWLADYPWVQRMGLSALTLAIVLGMVVGNTLYARIGSLAGPGVGFSKQTLLRLGIVLYGLRLTIQDIAQVGVAGVLINAVVVCATFILALWVGVRLIGLDRKTVMLIGAGSSICGAAAVLAAEPVVRGRSEQVTVAVATVVVFGTVATFLYPALFGLNEVWNFIPGGAGGFGIYIGSTIHEVAQVVASGNSISPAAADTAVIVKMVRVMMLAPFLIGLSAWLAGNPDPAESRNQASPVRRHRVSVPWFAVGFVVVVLFNSLRLMPQAVTTTVTVIDNYLLAMAMASLGLTTHVGAIKKAGLRPLVLALFLFAWLVVGGALLNRLVLGWLG
ncbi:YeiH family protein [Alicycliphilus denitrificans]|nr:YeiH family protein [Alicycliphilus denitrificans]